MVLKKEGGKFVLRSKKTGKVLGRGTKAEMLKREKQVRFFKNSDKSKGSLRSKVRKRGPS